MYKSLCVYTIAILVTFSALFLIFYHFDFSIPLVYSDDGLFTSAMIKSAIENTWPFMNSNLAAPGQFNLADYAQADLAIFLIIKLFSLFSHHYAVVLNLFYFFTFFLTVILSVFAMRALGLRGVFSLAGGLLFTFLPYHFLRDAHLFLNAYYVVPIYVLLIFSVFHYDSLNFVNHKWLKYFIVIVAILFAASSGIYYAFFACFFLLLAGILSSAFDRKWHPLMKAAAIIFLILLTIMLNNFQHRLQIKQIGENTQIANRSAFESETYGLKLTQLLLPVDNHRVNMLNRFKENYNHSAPFVNENSSASLGLIGSIGFFSLLLILFLREFIQNKILIIISYLNLSAILLGTVGGFGTFFAYTFSPMIRSYNRISVFIAFFAITAFFLLLQQSRFKKSSVMLAGLLLPLGLLDQVPKNANPVNEFVKSEFVSDQHFVQQIEMSLPKNSLVFQLPQVGFPEWPVVNSMRDYELFKGYLHSTHLHWSYGALLGRQPYFWQQEVSGLPLPLFLRQIVYAGFTGLYINKNGFKDQGVKIENDLSHFLNQTPLTNANHTLLFYDLRHFVSLVKNEIGGKDFKQAKNHIENDLKLDAGSRWSGFNDVMLSEENNSAKSKHESSIRVVNLTKQPLQTIIQFELAPLVEKSLKIYLSGLIKEEVVLSHSNIKIEKKLLLTPGVHFIQFKVDDAQFDKSERKKLFFLIDRFSVHPERCV